MKKPTLLLLCTLMTAHLAAGPAFILDAGSPSGKVSPRLYGLMTEEINHSYDGGLYAELIRNRSFQDDSKGPVQWKIVSDADSSATMALDTANRFNDGTSLKLTVEKATREHPAGVANLGYWGIPVQANTAYRATIWARAESALTGPVSVSIVSDDGKTVYATGKFSGLGPAWKQFEVKLKTRQISPTTKAVFQITVDQPATLSLGFVSLFPPTWNNRPNGFRKDLMQMLVDTDPKFLRFPGGNYLEGNTIETRFDWKKTLGPVEKRPGHPCPWGYRSTDGMGLLEFLQWCEDMKAEPVLAVYAGYSLRGAHVTPGPDLEPFIQEALEEIEYVMGDKGTVWGARRVQDGHPKPFKLNYVEIGNEDWFDKSGTYDARFAQFHDAIKARYPQLKTISSIANEQPEKLRVHSRKPDMLDEHYYRSTDEFLKMSPAYAREYDRSGPEIFVGEWGAHEDAAIKPWSPGARQQPPTPSLKAAIGDAVFMAAMERNSDLIKMQCYAPLLVNVNPGGRQWRPNLIGYDALNSYGSPSYYAIQIFSTNLGDEILSTSSTDTTVQGCATRNSKTGEVFLKLVNPESTPATLKLEIKGVSSVSSKASVITLTGKPEDTNSLEHPREVVPVVSKVRDLQPAFDYSLPPTSIVVFKFKAR